MRAERFAELVGARSVSAGKWQARCPAHEDGSPSLSIGTGQDGRVLLKCWAGCSVAEILAAMDLTLADLFDRPREYGSHPRSRVDLCALADIVDEAGLILEIGHEDLRGGGLKSPKDAETVAVARARLSRVAEVLRHAR